MQAQTILSTNEADAAKLLGSDPASIRSAFRRLAAEWHPDRRAGDPQAPEVMARLNLLREIAEGRRPPNAAPVERTTFRHADGRTTVFEALSTHPFDTGAVRVGRNSLSYAFGSDCEDLLASETKVLEGLRFPDASVKAEMERFLPRARRTVRLVDGALAVQERKSGEILLADLVARLGDRLVPKHVSWIVSGMMNVACFLEVMGLEHGAIDARTLLVSPKQHSVSLVGGWGFATAFGTRRRAAPSRSLSLRPEIARADAVADGIIDLELVRRTALDMVGSPSAAHLATSGLLPSGMTAWIAAPPGRSAVAEYRDWHDKVVLDFGPRRFTDLQVGEEDVYGRRRAAADSGN